MSVNINSKVKSKPSISSEAFLVLETGQVYPGELWGNFERAGEVVFNTSHSGYEEMSTDPSYFRQILVTTAPMQGNYGCDKDVWESEKIWIQGFVCLEIQNSERDASWAERLLENQVSIFHQVDTRKLVLTLREQGTTWGALVKAVDEAEAKEKAEALIEKEKSLDKDWVYLTSTQTRYTLKGKNESGPRWAVLDLGCKKNILRELQERVSSVDVFPSRTSAEEISTENYDAIMLSNGPGDPMDVAQSVETIQGLLGRIPVLGICMGHHLLSLALGAKTYKLKFGHRGSNHPVKDLLNHKIYMTSQNHGYAVDIKTLPKDVQVSHINLNDGTVSGICYPEKKCMSVQFHPESHPGPHDAVTLFDDFVRWSQ